jgi:hypothetical protein
MKKRTKIIMAAAAFVLLAAVAAVIILTGNGAREWDGYAERTLYDGEKYLSYSVSVDKDAFLYSSGRAADRFYLPGAASEVYMEIRCVDGEISQIKPGFLDDYIDFTHIEYFPYGEVAHTELYGEIVIATDGEYQTGVYLINAGEAVLAVVLSVEESRKEDQLDKFYALFSAIEFSYMPSE